MSKWIDKKTKLMKESSVFGYKKRYTYQCAGGASNGHTFTLDDEGKCTDSANYGNGVHNCRICGRVFCDSCCNDTIDVKCLYRFGKQPEGKPYEVVEKDYKAGKVRICYLCNHRLEKCRRCGEVFYSNDITGKTKECSNCLAKMHNLYDKLKGIMTENTITIFNHNHNHDIGILLTYNFLHYLVSRKLITNKNHFLLFHEGWHAGTGFFEYADKSSLVAARIMGDAMGRKIFFDLGGDENDSVKWLSEYHKNKYKFSYQVQLYEQLKLKGKVDKDVTFEEWRSFNFSFLNPNADYHNSRSSCKLDLNDPLAPYVNRYSSSENKFLDYRETNDVNFNNLQRLSCSLAIPILQVDDINTYYSKLNNRRFENKFNTTGRQWLQTCGGDKEIPFHKFLQQDPNTHSESGHVRLNSFNSVVGRRIAEVLNYAKASNAPLKNIIIGSVGADHGYDYQNEIENSERLSSYIEKYASHRLIKINNILIKEDRTKAIDVWESKDYTDQTEYKLKSTSMIKEYVLNYYS
ncbi:MAG: hypothetical protein GY750_20650 [Lentisphaerae bacterium]|nr:hypothetical protein [Lentisphaerota bacterium]MCP4103803.1 hypothetical protein [Lentisphaerota bacterium]